jgi:hypothetical protein
MGTTTMTRMAMATTTIMADGITVMGTAMDTVVGVATVTRVTATVMDTIGAGTI